MDAAESSAVIQRKGAYYQYGDIKLGQGRAQAIQAIRSDPAMLNEIISEIKTSSTTASSSGTIPDIAADVDSPFFSISNDT